MSAMTPMKCFRIKEDGIYTEDMAGHRRLICISTNTATRDFVLHALRYFHVNTPLLTWDNPARALAPFTIAQINALAEYQRSAAHEYTCKNGHGFLVPDTRGLICLWSNCKYEQDWAHAEHTGVK